MRFWLIIMCIGLVFDIFALISVFFGNVGVILVFLIPAFIFIIGGIIGDYLSQKKRKVI